MGHLIHLQPRFDTLYTSQSRTLLITGRDGLVSDERHHGLFVHQTRLLSRYRYLVDGQVPQHVASSNVEQHSWLGYFISPPPSPSLPEDTGSGQVPDAAQETIELRVSRYVGEGMHEDLDLTNFTQQTVELRLEVDLDGDFADLEEILQGKRQQHGELSRMWRTDADGVWELVFDYHTEHAYSHDGERGMAAIDRGLVVQVRRADSPPSYAEGDGRLRFEIRLPAHGTWHACLSFIAVIEGSRLPLQYSCRAFRGTGAEYDRRRTLFLAESTHVTAPGGESLTPVVLGALEQAKRDLASLRLYDLDQGERAWTMAAGLPIYIALFGRDTVTTAWQAALLGPEVMRGTLRVLARWQGTEDNPWRDEEPGKMLHEAHTGPLAILNFNPRARYYGSVTTSGFYPVVVSALWHWTGDRDAVWSVLKPALDGLAWLDRHGDLDGDGFYEYLSRSDQGVKHQAWKDSGDAIVYEDGSQVSPPIATCEEQAFVYVAKLHFAEVLWWLGEKDGARKFYREARELRSRFNEAFWMEDEGFYAMGLDAQKRQIRTIASNAGHCLAAGIADPALVRRIADRLMAPDLFSGWGVRTLSSDHPAYNPFSYHRGSVWPVENSTFGLGFMRYGLHGHLERLARALFDAASLYEYHRLPELFTGHARDADHPFPAFYPRANWPQAWSASAVILLLQSLLGVYPYAPMHTLFVDPHLPSWLPEITIEHLRVGPSSVDIRFFRTAEGTTDYRILQMKGPVRILRQPSPWSLTATLGERVRDAVTSLLPGR